MYISVDTHTHTHTNTPSEFSPLAKAVFPSPTPSVSTSAPLFRISSLRPFKCLSLDYAETLTLPVILASIHKIWNLSPISVKQETLLLLRK